MSIIPKISPSRSKADFFRRLNLQEHNEEHKQIYRDMMDEAARGRERTCQDQNNLTLQARQSSHLSHPYSSNMITETALHREVLNIYYTASHRTKPWYDLGKYVEGSNEENWVIRWCLWHVFRYRDERNRHRGGGGPFYFFQEREHPKSGYRLAYTTESMVPKEYRGYKVRRRSLQSEEMPDCSASSDHSEQSEQCYGGSNTGSTYYDPVRDLYG